MLTSYAQNFEDVILWRALKGVEQGFYIDIGAQDPTLDSVSLGFYRQGWRGIHVEPTPEYADALRRSRPDEEVIEAAIAKERGSISFHVIPGTGLSTGRRTIADRHAEQGYAYELKSVPAMRLADVLDRVMDREVHWLKLDCEGMEQEVIESWGSSAVRPWILVIEGVIGTPTGGQDITWEPALSEKGYTRAHFDGLNYFYVHEAHSNLAPLLAQPPNCFDNFVIGTESRWFGNVQAELTRLRHEASSAGAGMTRQQGEEIAGPILSSIARAQDSLGDLRGHTGHLEELGHSLYRNLDHAHARLAQLHDRATAIETADHSIYKLAERGLTEILVVAGKADVIETRSGELHRDLVASQTAIAALAVRSEAVEAGVRTTNRSVEQALVELDALRHRAARIDEADREIASNVDRLVTDATDLRRRAMRLETSNEELVSATKQTSVTAADARDRALALESQLSALRREMQQARLEAAARHEQIGRILENLIAATASQREQSAVADTQAVVFKQQLDAIERSTSWRVTAPLRALKTGIVRAPKAEAPASPARPPRGLKRFLAKRVLEPGLRISLRRPMVGAAVSHTLRLVPPLYRRLKAFAHARMQPGQQLQVPFGANSWAAVGGSAGDEALSAIQARATEIFDELLRQTKRP